MQVGAYLEERCLEAAGHLCGNVQHQVQVLRVGGRANCLAYNLILHTDSTKQYHINAKKLTECAECKSTDLYAGAIGARLALHHRGAHQRAGLQAVCEVQVDMHVCPRCHVLRPQMQVADVVLVADHVHIRHLSGGCLCPIALGPALLVVADGWYGEQDLSGDR